MPSHPGTAVSPTIMPQLILPPRHTNSRQGSLTHYPEARSSLSDGEENLPNNSLPSFWTSSSHYSSDSLPAKPKGLFAGIFEGWRYVMLGSYLNFLLVFVPISWVLSILMLDSHGLRFTFCILALIPLVKLHDISTHELAIRIGGSKTGLINASLSNTVCVVVAITALRKCELSVVQSSLIGSMLSKLLLVLGLCFFAGGMRFSEQVWNPTATQVHSSLLSISVGALMLPAAYHFTLSGAGTVIPEAQVRNILSMSHGVSIALLFIYGAYLLFQLWSHSHLYDDRHNKTSIKFGFRRFKPSESLSETRTRQSCEASRGFENPQHASVDNSSILLPPRPLYSQPISSGASSSQLTLTTLDPENKSQISLEEPTVRLVHNSEGYAMSRFDSGFSARSCSATTRVASEDIPGHEKVQPTREPHDVVTTPEQELANKLPMGPTPRVSWVLAVVLLVIVTIAASVTADELVESMDGISETVSKEWCGLILLPAVTSIAECMTAVNVSVKDRLTFSISVALGSTIQTALFVIPFIVILAWMMGKPLSLLMDPFQSLVLYISVQTMGYVIADGKSNWLEGLILICLYVIIAVSFWFYSGSEIPLGICTTSS